MAADCERINRDGGVWRLAWAKSGTGYCAWVVGQPDVAAEGATWEETEASIVRAVDERLHAGEWTADWDPPRPIPAGAAYTTHPDFVVLLPDGRFDVVGDPREYYTGGVCPACSAHRGDRTNAPLRVQVEILGGIMFTTYDAAISNANHLFRRSTIEALGAERLGGAKVRGVERVGRGRAEVIEVIPPAAAAESVAVQGVMIDGRRCPECLTPYFSNTPRAGMYINVYPRHRIPADVAAFWVGQHGTRSLCVRSAWWGENRGASAFRGVIADGLHVADEEYIDHEYSLPLR